MLRFALSLGAAFALLLGASSTAQALQLGFNDEDLLQPALANGVGVDDAGMQVGLSNASAAGASIFRVMVRWASVAPTKPPSDADARDPSWSGYQWTTPDRSIRAIVAAGMQPLPWIDAAPDWAEGAGRPPVSVYVPPGTWRPNASALEDFAAAVARRYSGTYPDPLHPGTMLPRVTTFQAWNEPNLYTEINPQYTKTATGWDNTAPAIFRSLMNAIYSGIKGVNPKATVVSAATAPFGDYPDGGHRTPPAEFWRNLLCVNDSGRTPIVTTGCPKVHFDAYAHNPYTPYPPNQRGYYADDVTVPDVTKITSTVRAAIRAGVVRPSGAKPLWITELGWDSLPDPSGVSLATQAEWMQGAIAQLARQGAQTILFWNSRDDAPVPDYDSSRQTGIFFRGATPSQDTKKPSWLAYRFPFSSYRVNGRTLLWGKAPAAGRVTVERQSGGKWQRYATLRAGSDGVFSRAIHVSTTSSFRASQGSFTSLPGTK